MKELEVLQSRQGTKVVTASNLHAALDLPVRQYGSAVRKWIRDIYEMPDGMRRPQIYRDFARRARPGEPMEDFYLTLDLAKLIALRSTSKHKLRYARLIDLYNHNGQLSLFD
jgi:phage anti-repressor protein